VRAFGPLLAAFSGWGGLPQKRFLCGNPKHLLALRLHGQDRLQQIPMMIALPNRTQPTRGGMVLVIDLGGILDQYHPTRLLRSHQGLRLLQMRTHQPFIADLRTLQKAIGRFAGGVTAQLGRQ